MPRNLGSTVWGYVVLIFTALAVLAVLFAVGYLLFLAIRPLFYEKFLEEKTIFENRKFLDVVVTAKIKVPRGTEIYETTMAEMLKDLGQSNFVISGKSFGKIEISFSYGIENTDSLIQEEKVKVSDTYIDYSAIEFVKDTPEGFIVLIKEGREVKPGVENVRRYYDLFFVKKYGKIMVTAYREPFEDYWTDFEQVKRIWTILETLEVSETAF